MIKILILDDNPKKIQKISLEISKVIDRNNIEIVTDIISAKRKIRDIQYDLLLLDIQIPIRIDQEARLNGGIDFLFEMKLSKRYKVPNHIIGITAYEETFSSANEEFQKHLYSLVKYSEYTDEWASQIRNAIQHIISTKSKGDSVPMKYDYELAIVCALDKVELDSIKKLDGKWEEFKIPGDNTLYYSGVFENDDKQIRVVAAAASQMGMTASSALTMKMIYNFKPNYLVMTGITAGIRGEVNLGDILAADPSWDYGSGKIKEENNEKVFYPDPNPVRLEADIRSTLISLGNNSILLNDIKSKWPADSPETSLKLHVGPVASGAAVLAHQEVIDSIIKHNRKLIGVEMESYGVLFSATQSPKPKPIAFALKSVCDFADNQKNDNVQRYAAYTSASLLYYMALNNLEYENEHIFKESSIGV